MNAKMGPAIGIGRIGRFIATDALETAGGVEEDCEPGSRLAVIQHNRVAQSTRKRASTGHAGWSVVRTGQAGEGNAGIGGDRRARDVDGTGSDISRIVESDDDLGRVIR